MMEDIIHIQEYLNAIVNINNACIYSDWHITIQFNELVKKGSFQASDKLSLFDDCFYEKFYILSKSGEKSFIGDYVEIINWKEEVGRTCEGYFFSGVSDLLRRFARKITNMEYETLSIKLQDTEIRKERSVNKFLTLIENFFKDDFQGVYLKGINSMKFKRIEPLNEFVFKSKQGVYVLKFESSD